MKVKFKKFSVHARTSEKETEGSACYDIFSARSLNLLPGETKAVETDIGMKFSKKYAGRLYPYSGLSLKPVTLGRGVIDSDFRGIISVILTNHSKELVNIEQGNRIAQMLFLKKDVDFVQVDDFDESERGVNGFGSTRN